MGISLEASEARSFPARPRYFDTLEVWEAADGQVLFLTVSRKRLLVYAIARVVFMAIHFFKPEVENPCPYEIEGLWSDEGKAAAQCDKLSAAGKAAMYGPVAVDRAFPEQIVAWRGAVRFTSLWKSRRRPVGQKLYAMVEESELKAKDAELGEWRSGRRETDCNRQLRETLQSALTMHDRVRLIECRVCRLEGERIAATGSDS